MAFVTDTEGSTEPAALALNATDAVFHGLYIIIPLMNAELLKVSDFATFLTFDLYIAYSIFRCNFL